MEKSLPLLAAHVGVGIAEYESDGGKKITFPGAVAPDDNIGSRGERFYDCLVFVTMSWEVLLANPRHTTWTLWKYAMCEVLLVGLGVPFEALDDDLLDMHLCDNAVNSTAESKSPEGCDQNYRICVSINMWAAFVGIGQMGLLPSASSDRCLKIAGWRLWGEPATTRLVATSTVCRSLDHFLRIPRDPAR